LFPLIVFYALGVCFYKNLKKHHVFYYRNTLDSLGGYSSDNTYHAQRMRYKS
jgi:hypothetical protein